MKFAIRTVTGLAEARSLWALLSPEKQIFDVWEFRYGFYLVKKLPIYFQVLYFKDSPVGLLPLQLNGSKLEMFGSSFMENNTVFVLPKFVKQTHLFTKSLPYRYRLESMDIQHPSFSETKKLEDYKYIFDISNCETIVDYLELLTSKKLKKNLKKLLRIFDDSTYVKSNPPRALTKLKDISVTRFGEQSSFYDNQLVTAFKNIKKLGLPLTINLFYAEKACVGASASIKHNKIYYYLSSAGETRKFSGIGNYVNISNIRWAIIEKCNLIDAGIEDLHWKKLWNFSPIAQYIYE